MTLMTVVEVAEQVPRAEEEEEEEEEEVLRLVWQPRCRTEIFSQISHRGLIPVISVAANESAGYGEINSAIYSL